MLRLDNDDGVTKAAANSCVKRAASPDCRISQRQSALLLLSQRVQNPRPRSNAAPEALQFIFLVRTVDPVVGEDGIEIGHASLQDADNNRS